MVQKYQYYCKIATFATRNCNKGTQNHLPEVPLSRMLTMEKSVKHIAPSPASTRAGIK